MSSYRVLFCKISIIFGIILSCTNSQYLGQEHNLLELGEYSANATTNNTSENVVKITVYYETLCPASVDFFTAQLRPAVEKLHRYLDVHLVPYGHAKTWRVHGRYKFRCQHGPAECYGNMLHACSMDALQNTTQAVLFNACLMQYSSYRADSGYDYLSALNWCGYSLNTPIHGVWQCVNSDRGPVLLKGYGVETHALRPRYVPHVVIQGSTGNQEQVTGNLMTAVCRKLSAVTACDGY